MRNLIRPAVLAGLVIALGMSQPATARDRNAERVLLGLAGVAVLAHVLNKREQRGKVAPPAVTPRRADLGARHRGARIDYNQCLRQRWVNGGWETFVSNRCVNRLQRHNGLAKGHWKSNARWNRGGLPRR